MNEGQSGGKQGDDRTQDGPEAGPVPTFSRWTQHSTRILAAAVKWLTARHPNKKRRSGKSKIANKTPAGSLVQRRERCN